LPEMDGKVELSNISPSTDRFVFDVSGVAALNSVSSNPRLLSICRLHRQRKGGTLPLPPPWSKDLASGWIVYETPENKCVSD
jgi:hypothetical protein